MSKPHGPFFFVLHVSLGLLREVKQAAGSSTRLMLLEKFYQSTHRYEETWNGLSKAETQPGIRDQCQTTCDTTRRRICSWSGSGYLRYVQW